MVDFDVVVAGAGVVGLACARALALDGHSVLVIEPHPAIGMETSSRNSEVIHAGIYYPASSLKARHCVEGKRLLAQYCTERGIAWRRCGKLIVAATAAQIGELERLVAKGKENGVDDLELLDREQALALEPALSCVAALHSPSSGIVDSHALMLSYQGDAENAGAIFVFNTRVQETEIQSNGLRIIMEQCNGTESTEIRSRWLINCAGLHAQALAQRIHGFPRACIPDAHYAKGNYFSLAGRAPFDRLVYPVPEEGGLGVHMTIDLAGQARFGPDVEWVSHLDYSVNPSRADCFYDAIRSYWPGLKDGALQPAYSGIRPKLHPEGSGGADFVIHGPQEHGITGIVQLFGIESPGLTSSLSIGRHVAAIVAAAE